MTSLLPCSDIALAPSWGEIVSVLERILGADYLALALKFRCTIIAAITSALVNSIFFRVFRFESSAITWPSLRFKALDPETCYLIIRDIVILLELVSREEIF
jgi:hypothetical protein